MHPTGMLSCWQRLLQKNYLEFQVRTQDIAKGGGNFKGNATRKLGYLQGRNVFIFEKGVYLRNLFLGNIGVRPLKLPVHKKECSPWIPVLNIIFYYYLGLFIFHFIFGETVL